MHHYGRSDDPKTVRCSSWQNELVLPWAFSFTAGDLIGRAIAMGESDADPTRSTMCLAVVALRYMAQIHPLAATYLVKVGLKKRAQEWLAQCKRR